MCVCVGVFWHSVRFFRPLYAWKKVDVENVLCIFVVPPVGGYHNFDLLYTAGVRMCFRSVYFLFWRAFCGSLQANQKTFLARFIQRCMEESRSRRLFFCSAIIAHGCIVGVFHNERSGAWQRAV